MKKILNILAVFGLTATTGTLSSVVVSCISKNWFETEYNRISKLTEEERAKELEDIEDKIVKILRAKFDPHSKEIGQLDVDYAETITNDDGSYNWDVFAKYAKDIKKLTGLTDKEVKLWFKYIIL